MEAKYLDHPDLYVRDAFMRTLTDVATARCKKRGDILVAVEGNEHLWLTAHYKLKPVLTPGSQLWIIVNSPTAFTHIDEDMEKKLAENNCFLSTEDCADVMRAIRNYGKHKEYFYMDLSILLYMLSISEQPVHLIFLQPLEPPFHNLLLEIVSTLDRSITITLKD